jgi:hypothetical protein
VATVEQQELNFGVSTKPFLQCYSVVNVPQLSNILILAKWMNLAGISVNLARLIKLVGMFLLFLMKKELAIGAILLFLKEVLNGGGIYPIRVDDKSIIPFNVKGVSEMERDYSKAGWYSRTVTPDKDQDFEERVELVWVEYTYGEEGKRICAYWIPIPKGRYAEGKDNFTWSGPVLADYESLESLAFDKGPLLTKERN